MSYRYDSLRLWDGAHGIVEDASLVLNDRRIAWIGAQKNLPDRWRSIPPIDGRGKLAIPGLINAHTHLYSSLARGMPIPGFSASSFSQILETLWWKLDKALDPASVRLSALVGAMEAARCGVTTLVDHHASPFAISGSLDALRQAVVEDVGLRGVFCYELSDRDGPERRDQAISENTRFLSQPASDHVAAQYGLHASFTVSDATLARVAETIPDDAGIHIHVAEGPEDQAQCMAKHHVRVIERLDRFGLLRPRTLLAHCLHVDNDERSILAERQAMVAHNPRSNMNNAVGSFSLQPFLTDGILTGLGTDGLGANMLAELFTAGLLQKHSHSDPLAGGLDALHQLLFVNNPAIATRLLGAEVGTLREGGPADLVVLEYTPPTPWTAENALGHLLYGPALHRLRVIDSFVGGRPILREGAFVSLEEEALYAEARSVAASLWKRIG